LNKDEEPTLEDLVTYPDNQHLNKAPVSADFEIINLKEAIDLVQNIQNIDKNLLNFDFRNSKKIVKTDFFKILQWCFIAFSGNSTDFPGFSKSFKNRKKF
jgi:hypothetical protein